MSYGMRRQGLYIVQETGIKTIPMEKKCKKAKCLSGEALQIAVKNPLLPANKFVWELVCYRESIYRHIIMDFILPASQAGGIGTKTTTKGRGNNTFFASVCNQGSLVWEGLLKSWI